MPAMFWVFTLWHWTLVLYSKRKSMVTVTSAFDDWQNYFLQLPRAAVAVISLCSLCTDASPLCRQLCSSTGFMHGILVVIKVLWPVGWVHCNSRYPSFILKIWQTLTNMDLHKSATSDFGFAGKKDRNFITIATHLISAFSQIYRALLISMAHWSASSSSGLIISQPATCITRGTGFFLATWHNIWIFSCRHRQKGRILRLSKHCKPDKRELTRRFLIWTSSII